MQWYQILLTFASGAIGWVFAKLKTPRENQKTDIELIKSAITPLLTSIQGLTEHNDELVKKLLSEQEKNLRLMEQNSELLAEKATLVSKIDSLEKKVTKLTSMVNKLAKNEKDHIDND